MRISKNYILAFLIVVIITATGLFIGLSKENQQPVRIATNNWFGYYPLYVAKEMGYIAESSMHLVPLRSASEVIRAYRNNAIDAAALTLDEVLLLKADQFDVEVVLVMDISNGGDKVIASPEIESLADIKGKRVGVETTALGAYVLSRLQDKAGLEEGDMTIVPLEYSEHMMAYQTGEVDLVITFEPVASQIIKQGGKQIFSSKQIPGEIVDLLMVDKSITDSKRQQLQDIVQGWFKALRLQEENPEQFLQLAQRYFNVQADEFILGRKGLIFPSILDNRELLDPQSGSLVKTADRLRNIMLKEGLLKQSPNVDEIFNNRLFIDKR